MHQEEMRPFRFLTPVNHEKAILSEDQIMMLAKRSCYGGQNLRGSERDPTGSFHMHEDVFGIHPVHTVVLPLR